MVRAAGARVRDAERSRELILDAAERLFARRGYDATSLAEIGEAAGVSRGTPSYFFGSKEDLYVAVLERMYADRNAALGPAFAPLVEWALAPEPRRPLRAVLDRCVDGYLRFLHGRPAYVSIIEREALAGGERLRRLRVQSTVMEDAFGVLRRRARAHGLRRFEVADAVLALVGLGYTPFTHRGTILPRHGIDLDDPRFLARRRRHVVDVLMALVGASD